jgi:hypothetical protein
VYGAFVCSDDADSLFNTSLYGDAKIQMQITLREATVKKDTDTDTDTDR